MERRTFLKVASFAVVTAAARLSFPWVAAAASGNVSYAGLLYRAGGAGKIETSADAGRTWSLHSDLGDMFSVTAVAVDRRTSRPRLTVGYARHTFGLLLAPDARAWLTI